ncbi:rho GTPase-activating protein 22 [Engraulis encrasicolus]|uniref:rho GTPase-activating protein 22 n=1 Tax=Engraulis encrasicolus TaxID=184585 RepID=UPI002FD608B1
MLSPKIRQTRRARSKSMVMGDVSTGGLRVCNSSSVQEGAIKAGWLRKQRSIMKNWQLRWFVLRTDLLYFYKDQEETKPQGCVRLQGCQVREQSTNQDEAGRHLFEILPGGGEKDKEKDKEKEKEREKEKPSVSHESLLLMAASQAEMEEWVKALQRAIGGGVFGRRLEETMEWERDQGVCVRRECDPREPQGVCVRLAPLLVEQCVCFIRQRGLQEEGLFRMPGQANLVKQLQDAFDHGDKPQFDSSTDVHTVASLLKLYLRELPEPVVPFSKFQEFMACAKLLSKDQEAGLLELGNQVKTLPQVNYNLLKYICSFLDEVQSYSDDNKMGVQNLATVFGPNILRSATDDPLRMMEGTSQVQQLMTVLISAHTRLFEGVCVCEGREGGGGGVCVPPPHPLTATQRCSAEWETLSPTTADTNTQTNTHSHTQTQTLTPTPPQTPPEPPRAESPSKQRPLSGWRCSFRGGRVGGSAGDVSSGGGGRSDAGGGGDGGGGGGGSWLMNGLSSLRNHRRTSSGERVPVRDPAHSHAHHRLSTYDNVSLPGPAPSLSVPSVSSSLSPASSCEMGLPHGAHATTTGVSPGNAAHTPGTPDSSRGYVCVSGRHTPESMCVSGRNTPESVCMSGRNTPDSVCAREEAAATTAAAAAALECVNTGGAETKQEASQPEGSEGDQVDQSERREGRPLEGASEGEREAVAELRAELKKLKMSYETRIHT